MPLRRPPLPRHPTASRVALRRRPPVVMPTTQQPLILRPVIRRITNMVDIGTWFRAPSRMHGHPWIERPPTVRQPVHPRTAAPVAGDYLRPDSRLPVRRQLLPTPRPSPLACHHAATGRPRRDFGFANVSASACTTSPSRYNNRPPAVRRTVNWRRSPVSGSTQPRSNHVPTVDAATPAMRAACARVRNASGFIRTATTPRTAENPAPTAGNRVNR